MPAKKKSILEKRLGESEARLKSALERLTKATKSYAAKNKQQAAFEKEFESLRERLENLTAEREQSLVTIAGLQEKLGELEAAAKQTADAPKEAAADQAAESQAMKSAIRDSLDATVGRLEALIAGRLKEAG